MQESKYEHWADFHCINDAVLIYGCEGSGGEKVSQMEFRYHEKFHPFRIQFCMLVGSIAFAARLFFDASCLLGKINPLEFLWN